jgi:hypothetical protein
MSFIPKNELHVDKHLTNVAMNYKQDLSFADRIAPKVKVGKQTDMVRTYSQADLWRINNTIRAPGTEANRIVTTVGSESYYCENYALRADITIEDRANADPVFTRNLEEGRTELLSSQLQLDWSRRIAQQVTNTTNVGTSSNVASAWTDNTNSDPWDDVLTKIDQIQDSTGYRPNRVSFGLESYRQFRRNNKVIDKIQTTGVSGAGQVVSERQVAELLEVDEIIVARGFYNAGEEGQAIDLQKIWDDHVLVYYAPKKASIDVPSFIYSFRWTAKGIPNFDVERLPFDRYKKIHSFEVGYYQDEKITSASLGGLVMYTNSSQ